MGINKKNITIQVWLLVIIFGVIYYSKYGYTISVSSFLSCITPTVGAFSILSYTFTTWVWKYGFVRRWFIPFPCLEGKWEAHITQIKPDDKRFVDASITIRQNFNYIQIILETNESKSTSICGNFHINKETGYHRLIYTFFNEPRISFRENSNMHYGTVILNISDTADKLDGEYWTSRSTKGEIVMKKQS